MSSTKKVTVGYRYYAGLHMILHHGVGEKLLEVLVDKKTAWQSDTTGGQITLNAPSLFGGDSREGGVTGTIDFEIGDSSQSQNSYLLSKLGSLLSAFRNVTGVVLRQCYIGLNPYLKNWLFRVQRIHVTTDGAEQWYDAKAAIVNSEYQLKQTVYHDMDANQAALTPELSATTYSVSGLSASDVVTLTVINSTYEAWSRWLGYGSDPGYFFDPSETTPLWWCRVTVRDDNGDYTHYFDDSEITSAAAFATASASGSVTLTGSTSYDFWLYDDALQNRGGLSLKIEGIPSDAYDMNPAHIIREGYTDPDWGLGYSSAEIDSTSFMASADTLYDELFGLSLIWKRQTTIEEFLDEILRYIDGVRYVSRSTGKIILKLIRDDYALSDLTTLTEDDIERVDNFKRNSFGELVNSITVIYTNPVTGESASTNAKDIALIRQQGSEINTTIQYPGVTNGELAARIAARDLRALSTPLRSFQVTATRKAASLNLGDAVIIDWPDLDINSVVMRVERIDYGDGKSNKVVIALAEDVFAIDNQAFIASPPRLWQSPSGNAEAASPRLFIEAPYMELVQRLGETGINDVLADIPEAAYVLAAGGRPASAPNMLNARLYIDAGGGYEDSVNIDFCPYGYLVDDLGITGTAFEIDGDMDMDLVEALTHCQIDDELMRIDSVVENSAGNYDLTVGRGILDTVPKAHSAGATIIFWDVYSDTDSVQYVSGETLYGKLLTNTGSNALALDDAPINSAIMVGRANKPYPPGNLTANGESYPLGIEGDSYLTIGWAHRDRTQQTGGDYVDHTEADIGPETNVTYEINIYDEDDNLLITAADIATTSYEFADELIPIEDPFWANVSVLLNMNGVDEGTSFPDSGPDAKTFTASGNVNTEVSIYKFGGSSGQFDGSTDYVFGPTNDSDFNLGAGDFTIDGWVYRTSTGTTSQHVFGIWDGAAQLAYHVGIKNDGKVFFEYSLAGTFDASRSKTSAGSYINVGSWYYIDWTREGTTMKVRVDGVTVLTHTCGTDTIFFSTSVPIKIGANSNSQDFTGHMQDIRLTKGAARYTADYSPPTRQASQYINLNDTLKPVLRYTVESIRDANTSSPIRSYQAAEHTVLRPGWGWNWGKFWGGSL